MRMINENYETITEFDLNTGKLISATVVRSDATPIDNVTKFAWAAEDYENVQMYIPDPVKTIQQQIAELKAQLSATDYQIIKCSECQLLGLEMPYDIAVLYGERQALRNKINDLEREE